MRGVVKRRRGSSGLYVPVSASFAADYYVAVAGSDSYPGTLAQPFATVGKALSVAVGGQTVAVRGGSYPGIDVRNNNARGSYLTFVGFPGETASFASTLLVNSSYLRLQGLTVSGSLRVGDHSVDPSAGGACDHVQVAGCVNGVGNNWTCRWGSDAVLFEDCLIAGGNADLYGLIVSSSGTNSRAEATNVTVRRCTIKDWRTENLILVNRSTGTLIEGCDLSGSSRIVGSGAHPDIIQTTYLVNDLTIRGCFIHDNPNSDGMLLGKDYALTSNVGTPTGLTLENNLIATNNYAADGGGFQTIKIRNYDNVLIRNNTYLGNGGNFLIRPVRAVTGWTVVNNIFSGYDEDFSEGGSITYVEKDHNLVAGLNDSAGPNDVAGSGTYVGPTGGPPTTRLGYRLAAGSLGLDGADPSSYPATDIDGRVRPVGAFADVGCYERQAGDP